MRFEKAASLMASLCRLHVEVEIWRTIEQQSWHGKIRHGLGEDRFLPKELKDQSTPHRPFLFANLSKLFFMIVLVFSWALIFLAVC